MDKKDASYYTTHDIKGDLTDYDKGMSTVQIDPKTGFEIGSGEYNAYYYPKYDKEDASYYTESDKLGRHR